MVDAAYFLDEPGEGGASGRTLSLTDSPTVLLVFAANRFTRSAARLYQQRFGLGAMDWRMLVMLTREPDIPVSRASEVIGIDKAAVSRSLGRLEKMGLAEVTRPTNDPRRGVWRLTDEGAAQHDRILSLALERQAALVRGFSEAEVRQFTGMLRRFIENQERLDAAEAGPARA